MPTPAFRASIRNGLTWPGGSAPCVFGRSGALPAADKREGDGASPLGPWPLRRVFYRPDRIAPPQTGLAVVAMTQDMGWCDDPASPDYNRLVHLPFAASHEKLWREDRVYDVVVELGYNDDPPNPGSGSAIFLHLMQPDARPTEGCVACRLEDMLALLAAAKPGDTLEIAP
jgi:L,D-peptidoglycan transpeptidase YkuD (ErfK/YbiS/YcfS/YnhG family)